VPRAGGHVPTTGTGAGVHGRLWGLVGALPAAPLSAVRRRACGLPGQARVAARDVGHEGQAGHPGGQSVPKAWPNARGAGDGKQAPLLRRSTCSPRLTPSVGHHDTT
jgi:hypothetical protein